MPIAPDQPFPKLAGHVLRSKDWNDLVAEVRRLDVAKVDRAGDTIKGRLTVQDPVGVSTASPPPGTRLHVFETAAPAVLRIQSGLAFGPARLEMWSDPRGSATEWRPGYIQSYDSGGFTGGLSFVTNGTGMAQRRGDREGMRLVNGRLAVGAVSASPAVRLHVTDDVSPAVVRIQSAAASGAGRLEMWSDPQGSVNEWRPGYIQAYDAGAAGGFTGGLSFVTNGTGVEQRQGSVEAMRIVNGRVGVGAMAASPAARLHVMDNAPLAVLRVQSAAASGVGRLEMWSDPQGSPTEWRPGYVQGFDAGPPGGFVGGLSFGTNGAGAGQRQGELEAMRLVNGRVGIGAGVAPASRLHVVDNASPAVLRVQSTLPSGAARLEMWSDSQGSANEWRPGYIQAYDAGGADGFTGGLSFVTNGKGHAQRQGEVEAMRLVDGRVGIGVPAPARILDVADRIRVRQGPSGGAGISLYQNGPGTDRASLVMTSDNVVSLMGSANWGLNMDVTNGHVGVRTTPVGPPWVLYVVGDSLVSGRLRDGKLRMHAVAANRVEISSTIDKPAWSPVPNLSLTVVGPSIGAWFLIRFNMNGLEHGGVATAHAEFRLLIDGGQHDYTLHQFHGGGWQRRGVCLERMIWLGPGAHPVVVQWSIRSPEARPEGPLDPVPVVVTLAGCASGDYRFLSAIEL